MMNQGDIRVKGAAGVDTSPLREIADQPSLSPTAGGREAAAVHGAAPSTEKLKKRPLSSHTVHFIVVAVLFALGIGQLWLTTLAHTNNGLQRLQQFSVFWSAATPVAFLVSLGILYSGIARRTALYPLVVFLVSLQAVEKISMAFINNGEQPFLDIVNRVVIVTHPTLVLFISGLYTLFFAAATALIGSSHARATVAEDVRRRRIRDYFESRPIWPWVVSGLAVLLILFSVTGQPASKKQLFLIWNQTIIGFFGVSVILLLFDDAKRRPVYYFYLFVVLYFGVSDVLNNLSGYPYEIPDNLTKNLTTELHIDEQIYGNPGLKSTELINILDTYYKKYWLSVAVLTIAYAGIFRFLLFPRFHLATDVEVDECIAEDLKPAVRNSFKYFGIERSGLVAEPLSLRNFPNRSNISGAFIGSWIGDDDRLRFTPQTETVIAFAEEHVMFYNMTVDLTTGTIINETMAEFFYQDICNVERVSTTQLVDVRNVRSFLGRLLSIVSRTQANREQQISDRTVNDKLQLPGRDVFQISLNNGHYLLVVLRDTTFFDVKKKRIVQILTGIISAARTAQADPDINLPMDENERMVRNIRSMLRDKKRALLLEQR